MAKRLLAPVAFLVAALVLLGGSAVSVAAQGTAATPMASPGMATTGHPAHIHKGTCDTLGDIAYPLNNLVAPGMMASPAAGMEATAMASPSAMMGPVVAESTTTVKVSLNDIISGGHAINVHESVEKIQNYIACGDVKGTATGGELQIELHELNSSGFMGQATLKDNGDGTTTVTVQLMQSGSTASPVATPA